MPSNTWFFDFPKEQYFVIISTLSPITSPLSRWFKNKVLQTFVWINKERISFWTSAWQRTVIQYSFSDSSFVVIGLIYWAKGRNNTFETINIHVAQMAIVYLPVLVNIPIALVHHNIAAVFMPLAVPLSLNITPLQRNPTPEIIELATRNTSSDLYNNGNNVKKQVHIHKSTLIRMPAIWTVNCLSRPIRKPSIIASRIRIIKS